MHIEETVLNNGLTIMSHTAPHFESAAIGAFVNVGSRYEDQNNNGIAHFLEHMMFKGTSTRTAYDIATEVEVMGSDINAWTSMDMTAYYCTGISANVGESIDIIGDILTDSQFAEEDIGLERGVIIQEINRSADDPSSVMHNTLQSVSYTDQSFGRTVLGSPEFVMNARQEDFRQFVGQYYTANNIIVTGAGGFKHEDFVRRVEQAFGGLRSGPSATPTVARYVGGTTIDRNRNFRQASVGIAFESVSGLHDDMYRHYLLADAFGGGMSSPLVTEIREKRGLVYTTGCYASMGADNGRIIIAGGMTSENVEEFVTVACQEFRKMCDHISETDLLRAKNSHLTGIATLHEQTLATANFMAKSFWQRGYVRSLDEMREGIHSVTLADLKRAAEQVIATKPSIAMIGPVPELDFDALVRQAIA